MQSEQTEVVKLQDLWYNSLMSTVCMTFRETLLFHDLLTGWCDILTKGPSYIVKRRRYPLGEEQTNVSNSDIFERAQETPAKVQEDETSCSSF